MTSLNMQSVESEEVKELSPGLIREGTPKYRLSPSKKIKPLHLVNPTADQLAMKSVGIKLPDA